MCRQNTMQASTAGSAFPPASIILLSRPVRRPGWPRSATLTEDDATMQERFTIPRSALAQRQRAGGPVSRWFAQA